MRQICPICDMSKQEYKVGIAKHGFTSNMKTPQKTHEFKKINEELKHAKRKLTQLTRKLDTE